MSHSVLVGMIDRPCVQCRHFGHWIVAPGTAWCAHPQWAHTRAQAERGCCSWEREVGADDEGHRGQDTSQA